MRAQLGFEVEYNSPHLLKPEQWTISPDCVFDASLVPETCADRFVDLKGLTQQVYGESHYLTMGSGLISLVR